MSELYGWVSNITYYLIFMTVMMNLLPNKKYEKYIKLFAGMVLLLLVMKPVTGGLHIEDRIASYFENISFKKETDILRQEFSGIEDKRLEKMIESCEEAIEMDIERMAENEGFYKKYIDVEIEKEQDADDFGAVKYISMQVSLKQENNVAAVVPVEIGKSENKKTYEEKQNESSKLNELRRKIEDYYNLEAEYVQIQLENGEG